MHFNAGKNVSNTEKVMSKKYEVTAMAYNKRGKLLAVGRNSYCKTHPLQARLGMASGRPAAIYLHAETVACLKAREPIHELRIYRYDNDGNPANSKPCPACQLLIQEFNIKKVFHT